MELLHNLEALLTISDYFEATRDQDLAKDYEDINDVFEFSSLKEFFSDEKELDLTQEQSERLVKKLTTMTSIGRKIMEKKFKKRHTVTNPS